MAVFQCKMCAGNLHINPNDRVCTCDYCGTEQTVARIDNDEKERQYLRASHHRLTNDFSAAMSIYEGILRDDPTDAESYWSLILCRYGIEYVEDSGPVKRKPTVRRTQFTSVFDDNDYKEAINYATDEQKILYEKEAKVIDGIQKRILEISSREKPFDVFICYKESDANGNRTKDSVIGMDLYNELNREGLKVFFSRVTLEDVKGEEYEPYIFAALNSAKIMLSIGTRTEYFNAPWVKNEWSRYQLLLNNRETSRYLIPVYNDVKDLPSELSYFQGQDINKIGYLQDLVYQVKKIIEREKPQSVSKEKIILQQAGDVNVLMKRAQMDLEDGEWEQADGFYEQVLNFDAENAEAYMGKLYAKYHKTNIASLTDYFKEVYISCDSEKIEGCEKDGSRVEAAVKQYVIPEVFEEVTVRRLYSFDRYISSKVSARKKQKELQMDELSNEKFLTRAKAYATGELKDSIEKMLEEIEQELDRRIEKAENDDIEAKEQLKKSYSEHLDKCDVQVKEMQEDAIQRKEEYYQSLIARLKKAHSKKDIDEVKKLFEELHGYKESAKYVKKCDRKKAGKHARRITIILTILATPIVALAIFLFVILYARPNSMYKDAVAYMENGNYDEAMELFDALDDFKDSKVKYRACNTAKLDSIYDSAVDYMEEGKYDIAISMFSSVPGYKMSDSYLANCEIKKKDEAFDKATQMFTDGDIEGSYRAYLDMDGYKTSNEMVAEIAINYPNQILQSAKIGDPVWFGNYENEPLEWIVVDKKEGRLVLLSKYAIKKDIYSNNTGCVWEESDTRKWLNSTFYEKTFDSEEQKLIIDAKFTYDDGSFYNNRVFLPSSNEVEEWFSTDDERTTTLIGGSENISWWLRDTGGFGNMDAGFVSYQGNVFSSGDCMWNTEYGIRPAMEIDLSQITTE